MLGDRRQCLHQDETAKMRRDLLGEFRQRREGLDLIASVRALARGIEQHQHAPFIRKREARDNRRDTCCGTASAVDRSEERRVGKECRFWWWLLQETKNDSGLIS